MIIRLQGIVLKNKAYRESDQLLSIFSPERGKLTMVVQGSKKLRSRFGAVTEPFTIASFICYQHNSTSMPTLTDADIIAHNKSLRSDLLLTAYGAYWIELVDRVVVEKEPQLQLYTQFLVLLEQLNSRKDPEILTRLVELVVLKAAGYQPVFTHCVCCKASNRPVSFSVLQGGFLCSNCTNDREIPLTSATVHYLRILNELPVGLLGEVNIKLETKQQLEMILQKYLDTHLELNLKSRAILQQLKATWD
jgi:DNA repair protein RecO (recombination protein O)